MAVISKIKQLQNNNVVCLDSSGDLVGNPMLPSTQLYRDGNGLRASENAFPFIIKIFNGTIDLETKDGTITTFTGTTSQLLKKLYEDGFFFDVETGSFGYKLGLHAFADVTEPPLSRSYSANDFITKLIYPKRSVVIDGIGLEFAGATAGNAIAAIYQVDKNMQATKKLVQTTAFDTSITTGVVKTVNDTTLIANTLYAAVYLADTVVSVKSTRSSWPSYGHSGGFNGELVIATATLAYTTALPDDAPTMGGFDFNGTPLFLFNVKQNL